MKINKCELVFILDRSGSMAGLESDTIGGFNSMLSSQKKATGDAQITTVLFDDKYQLLHDRVNLSDINPITQNEYFVRGTTALLDAIGKTISKIKNVQKTVKADKVLFVIITDGLENASREYSHKKIRNMILSATQKHKWEFIFLGANIDAIATANDYGISAKNAINYHPDAQGTQASYQAVCSAVSQLRSKKHISGDWKAAAEVDFSTR